MANPPPSLRKLVVVEDALLLSMAANAQFVALVPGLSALKGQTSVGNKGCKRCGSKVDPRTNLFNTVKTQIANADIQTKRRLLQLLNAERVRVRFSRSSGTTEERTIGP